jgi:hypothetical protein
MPSMNPDGWRIATDNVSCVFKEQLQLLGPQCLRLSPRSSSQGLLVLPGLKEGKSTSLTLNQGRIILQLKFLKMLVFNFLVK